MALQIGRIKGTDVDITDTLRELIEEKIGTLDKFLQDHDSVQCDVELEKVTASQSGNIFRAEANIIVDGTLAHRAEATTDQIEKSIDEVRDELSKEIRRANDKHRSLVRRGGARIKEMLAGSPKQ